ncbi:MAG: helix-turn-helix domain-containing protein [Candidatus Coatesbacteria bacterium]
MADERYSATEAARRLGIGRATLYRWIDRRWITKPAKDYKGDPVFTDGDVERIRAWKDRIVREKAGRGKAGRDAA